MKLAKLFVVPCQMKIHIFNSDHEVMLPGHIKVEWVGSGSSGCSVSMERNAGITHFYNITQMDEYVMHHNNYFNIHALL